MKLIVTGASGLLGHEVVRFARKEGHETYSVFKEHQPRLGEPVRLDLTDKEQVSKIMARIKPQAVIHTAAYTDVDSCEINRDFALKTNAEATKHLAVAAAASASHLIYVSTDYVFDGEKGFYREEDKPNPISFYGYTKLKGEEHVQENAEKWCIARASVIYGWSQSEKLNFTTWLMKNMSEGKEIKVLVDQFVSPTLNTNLAEMLKEIAEENVTGLLHTAGATRVSRYEFALTFARVFKLNTDLIKPAKTDEMSWNAKRPRDSSLNVSKAGALLDVKPLRLEQALESMRNERLRARLQVL